jgi:hypothetical protein
MRRLLFALLVSACGAPEPPQSSGGTDEPPGPCGRGIVVIGSGESYGSTNVSLVAFDGRVLSPSFVSSAARDVGLSAPLSGDVVAPSMPELGDSIVLIDRFSSALTWVEVASARVRQQLALPRQNPQDFLNIEARKAYVTPYQGSELVLVDPALPGVTDRLDLSSAIEDARYLASPGRSVEAGGRAIVVLEAYEPGFTGSAASRVVAIDPATDAVADLLVLQGAHGCSGLALSPRGDEIALACSGGWRGSSNPDPSLSWVVRVGLGDRLAELARFAAGAVPFGQGIDYAGDERILVTRFGEEETSRPDALVEIDFAAGSERELLRAAPFQLGDIRCAAACGVCFATDAEAGVVHRFELDERGRAGASRPIVADTVVGTSPRELGRF